MPSRPEALRQIRKLFASLFGLAQDRLGAKSPAKRAADAELVIQANGLVFVVEYKGSGDAALVTMAVQQAKRYAEIIGEGAVPVVAVSFMGEVGHRICEQAGVSWVDLAGNARIAAPGIRIHVEGKPNRFKRPGRPSTVFAPKSSRVVRHLLMAPQKSHTQRELAKLARLDEGFVSRIVRRLEADRHLLRDDQGAVRVADPNALLDAWSEAYSFSRHSVSMGHITSRSSEEVVRRLTEYLTKHQLEHAFTGLGAAWVLTRFAGFRLVTVYIKESLDADALVELGIREEPRGANVWLVTPNDEGVFDGSSLYARIRCVHPVQTFLDLKGQPERAAEAALELRRRLLTWSTR